MKMQSISTPINEEIFLKRNALLGLLLGTFFTSEIFYALFKSNIEQYAWLKYGLVILGFIIFIAMITMLIKTLKSAERLDRNTFWFSNFQDEYFSHINNKGYKYAFNILTCFLMAIVILSDFFPEAFATFSIQDFGKIGVGLLFVSYSLPVLYLLRGENE